jgi:vacuolar-type H+-ATPase subunit H
MEKLLQEVLSAEKNVEHIIEAARERAAVLRREAEQKSADALAEARLKVQQIIRDAVEKARSDAAGRRATELEAADRENSAFRELRKAEISALIQEILAIVLGPESNLGKK